MEHIFETKEITLRLRKFEFGFFSSSLAYCVSLSFLYF